jgi:threonine/homoserine/homoserine lactone efflux protein
VGRGLWAMIGANGTFGILLLLLALGLPLLSPTGVALRVLQVAGGAFLIYLAADTFRATGRASTAGGPGRSLPPASRGVVAVILNPGAWIFLATTATALVADATRDGGRALAVLTSGALLAGVMVADGAVVAVGAGGRRGLRGRAWNWLVRTLSLALAALGIWLVARGLLP